MIFPCFIYHKEKSPDGKIFQIHAELESAGYGWVDTPAKYETEEPVPDLPIGANPDPEFLPEIKKKLKAKKKK